MSSKSTSAPFFPRAWPGKALLASAGGRQIALAVQLADQLVAPARAKLSQEQWAAACADGRALSQEQAIAEAVGGVGEGQVKPCDRRPPDSAMSVL
jgi:hypothetical protein